MSLFTAAELEELRRADAEIDKEYALTPQEIKASRKLDREAELERMDPQKRRVAAQKAAYYEANKERIAAQQAAYREANKERIAAYQAAYYEANKERIAAYQAAYREANKEQIAAQKAAYYEANKERIAAQQAAYYEANKERIAAYQAAYYEHNCGVHGCAILREAGKRLGEQDEELALTRANAGHYKGERDRAVAQLRKLADCSTCRKEVPEGTDGPECVCCLRGEKWEWDGGLKKHG